MFLRKKENKSGSISVQIISKTKGKYKVVKTIGSGKTEQEILKLYFLGKQELEGLFRHLVVSRLAFSGSKLKTIDYLYRYQGVGLNKDRVYRFLDKLNNRLKSIVEDITFSHTKKIWGSNISVVTAGHTH